MTDEHEKNGESNGSGNGDNEGPERNEKGQFVNFPGPGRGKSEARARMETIDDLIDLIEEAARDGIIKSKDLKERLTAAKVGLKVAELKKTEDEDKVTIPAAIQKLLDLYKQSLVLGGWEGIQWIIEHCADCQRFNWGEHTRYQRFYATFQKI